MVAPTVEGIDPFKIAGRSISGWVPSFKTGTTAPIRQPFCSQLEERLLLWLEYHPQVACYARGDIGQAFATTYRLPTPKHAPFCRIEGHTSEEVREILAALETIYREALPQFNLRQWSGAIYTWLTQPVLDPTASGRVTMDYLMKLVKTALEWSHEASEKDVKAKTLEKAAELLVLRRDTLRIIDGAGPSIEVPQPDGAEPVSANGTETQRETVETVKAQVQASTSSRGTFSGVVSIDVKRFAASSVALVECPDCSRMRSLSPHKGVLRFPSHDQRKMQTPVTSKRWARGKTDWDVVGGAST